MVDLFGSQGTVQPGPSIWEKFSQSFSFGLLWLSDHDLLKLGVNAGVKGASALRSVSSDTGALACQKTHHLIRNQEFDHLGTNLMVNRDLYVVFGRHVYSSPGRLDCIWNWTRTPIEECRLNYWVSKLHLRWNITERRLTMLNNWILKLDNSKFDEKKETKDQDCRLNLLSGEKNWPSWWMKTSVLIRNFASTCNL